MRLITSRFHFIGVGGVGMSGLAELLMNMGAKVTGSDLSQNALVERLQSLGMEIHIGHKAENLGAADVVVYSSAIPSNNPEIDLARKSKVPIIPRAEVLAEIMRLKRGVAIGGSHGKTTTTSLVASVLIHAKQDPTVVVGGRLDLIKSTSVLGQGDWLVAEADESDGSFLKLSPEIAVVTNIDDDHLDFHGSLDNLENSFLSFMNRVPFYGVAIVCGDDQRIMKQLTQFRKRVVTYGREAHNDYVLKGDKRAFSVFQNDKNIANFMLQIPGAHNGLNALAALVVGIEVGLTPELAARGLEEFRGVDRRLQKLGVAGGITLIDDYGHHPTEVRAVISALREHYPTSRLVVAFQPHRFSRTKQCWDSFKTSFDGADSLYLWDIYPAGEKPLEGIHSEKLAGEIVGPRTSYVGSGQQAYAQLLASLKPGDVCVTLGAGDIGKLGPQLLKDLSARI
ncbi:MAG: UDP-N-acetylmuramate--L-alanine ligase [Bdellovibrionales bacterium]|nr:UDP-N-acetylmuramate--L-alanine ligase [Bdellovibrionales bacterium]